MTAPYPIGATPGSWPSVHVLRAAKTAASSPHALINLTRLIRALDSQVPISDPDDSPLAEVSRSPAEHNKDRTALIYARALLDTLQTSSEGSATDLAKLSAELDAITIRYEATTIGTEAIPSRPPSRLRPAQESSATAAVDAGVSAAPTGSQKPTQDLLSASSVPPAWNGNNDIKRRRRAAPSLNDYLAKRQKDDEKGGEAGLLPLRNGLAGPGKVGSEIGMSRTLRDQLLAGQRSEGVMGNSQLHEELGGQLAEMSHRLKLNAIHFANSLEAEKPLLESSQQTLESNLTATQSSKKQLGTVTRKGRGTTCLTLGVVLLVLIIFVWTYLLIRFT